MTNFKMNPGDIVLVKFPFTDLKSEKKRPALVLGVTHFSKSLDLVVVSMITSKLDGLSLKGDVKIDDWENAKLLHPSIVRLSKIATLDSEIIEKKLGTLSAKDQKLIKAAFRSIFPHWL